MKNNITRILKLGLFGHFSLKVWKFCQGPKIAFCWNSLKILVSQGIKIAQKISCRLSATVVKLNPFQSAVNFSDQPCLRVYQSLHIFYHFNIVSGKYILDDCFLFKDLETVRLFVVHLFIAVVFSIIKACRKARKSRLTQGFVKNVPDFAWRN